MSLLVTFVFQEIVKPNESNSQPEVSADQKPESQEPTTQPEATQAQPKIDVSG